MPGRILSVVVATMNRNSELHKCLQSVYETASHLNPEVIVVDGGDALQVCLATPLYVRRFYRPPAGAVDAYNFGFAQATGEFVAAMNDDAVYLPGALDNAVDYLRRNQDCGQVAIPYLTPDHKVNLQSVHIGKQPYVLLALYANFGVTRRALGDALGWWGNYLRHYGGDCELSANIWDAGFKVAAAQTEPGI